MAFLQVHLVTPEREVWSGQARFLSARALEGDVGVLPGHAPLLTSLRVGAVLIDAGEGRRLRLAVDGGFLHIAPQGEDTRVNVLAEHAQLSEELTPEDIARLREHAAALREAGRFDEARTEEAKAATRERISE